MENFEKEDIELLRCAVEKKFGGRIMYAKDCVLLSDVVFEKTGAKISQTTIKRLWNLVNSSFNPSKYTLNSLSAYVGFADFEAFVSAKKDREQDIKSKEVWLQIQRKARLISLRNYYSITSRMGVELKNTVRRKFAGQKFEKFMDSDKTATAFIAPGGYGKSTIVASLVYDYFLYDNAVYQDDIVWLIDCAVITDLKSSEFDIEEFLLSLLGYSVNKSFMDYFDRNPESMCGRMVIFFDGLNELQQNGRIHLLENIVRVIAANSGQQYIKMVFTARPDLWSRLCKMINESANLKKCWFDVEFSTNPRISANVPPLKMQEVEQVLMSNNAYDFSHIAMFMHGGFSNIARIPYFLHIYISLAQTRPDSISDIDLLREYMKRKIIEPPEGAQNIELIDKILQGSNYGLGSDYAVKDNIEIFLQRYTHEYANLIDDGIIYEYKHIGKFLVPQTYIKFSHSILFEFLLANHWLRKYGFTEKLLEKVSTFYHKNPVLKYQIVLWIIKYSFKEKQITLVKDIFKLAKEYFQVEGEKSDVGKRLVNIVGIELRKFQPNERDKVLEHFAKDADARAYYYMDFCDIDNLNGFYGHALEQYFLKYANQPSQLIFGRFLKLIQSLFNKSRQGIAKYYEEIKSLSCGDMPANIHAIELAAQLIYLENIEKEVPTAVLQYVAQFAKEYYRSMINDGKSFDYNSLILLDTLSVCRKFKVVEEVCAVLSEKYESFSILWDEYNIQTLLIYSQALLRDGRENKARRYFSHIELVRRELLPANTFNYWTMRYCQIASEFYENGTSQYVDLTQKAAAIAKYLQFPYFVAKRKQLH